LPHFLDRFEVDSTLCRQEVCDSVFFDCFQSDNMSQRFRANISGCAVTNSIGAEEGDGGGGAQAKLVVSKAEIGRTISFDLRNESLIARITAEEIMSGLPTSFYIGFTKRNRRQRKLERIIDR